MPRLTNSLTLARWRELLLGAARRPFGVLATYVVAWMALDFATESLTGNLGVSLWFAPTGLSLALLLIFGVRYAPALAFTLLLHILLFRGGTSYPA